MEVSIAGGTLTFMLPLISNAWARNVLIGVTVCGAFSCRTGQEPFATEAQMADGPAEARQSELESTGLVAAVLELYRSFDFDAGSEPDWEAQRRIALEGATFLSPAAPGRELSGEGVEEFIAGFRSYATSPRMAATGLHERVTSIQGHAFGGIAQLFVTFEGHLPGDSGRQTHGVDGLTYVRSGSEWRLVSFVSQYEREDLQIPASFGGLLWTRE